MSLKDKAKGIDLSNIAAAAAQLRQNSDDSARTVPGRHADAMFRDLRVIAENDELKAQVLLFKDSNPEKRIDPKKIHPSRWANRHELSFDTPEFQQLKAEIESAGGNIQAIKIRPLKDRPGEYEIVFGHRRHHACLELGISVLAVIEDMDDMELFCQMDRENRQRANLRPYEIGAMYARALDDGLFSSVRRLASMVGMDHSNLGKALTLARLPTKILAAFENPLELQYHWGVEITQAMQKDPDGVIAIAERIVAENPRPKATVVLERLIADMSAPKEPRAGVVLINGKNGVIGKVKTNPKKRTMAIELKKLDPKRFDAIQAAIQKAIS